MAQVRPNGPTAAPRTSQPIPSELNAQIDLLVSLHLWAWPALTLAIQNGWGGSQHVSSDKRDWLAGAISDLLVANPRQIADVADLEEVLLQVMLDEFEIVVDDGSAEETAKNIWASALKVQAGDINELQELHSKWQEKQAKGGEKVTGIVKGEERDAEETDWDDDDDDEEEEEWNGFDDSLDVNMSDQPQALDAWSRKDKIEPEVDEDGFTKVVSKKKR